MGQYFRAVNKTKKEVVCPWCVGGIAKLWEWAVNPWGALFVLLLRKSDGSGGGDYYGYSTQVIELNDQSPKEVMNAVVNMVSMEGRPAPIDPSSVVGRWAGDEVYLVGDYDTSRLYQESCGYQNISKELVEAWNGFIDRDDMRLTYNPECNCTAFVEESVKS